MLNAFFITSTASLSKITKGEWRLNVSPVIWSSVLLYLRSLKVGCFSISDHWSCSYSLLAKSLSYPNPFYIAIHFYYRYENALRRYDPTITIPYWDSTLDSKLGNPSRSILWSDRFFGNGNGIVRNGHFVWNTPYGRLRRNHGRGSTLMTEWDVQGLMQLTDSRTFNDRIEMAHNQVHRGWAPSVLPVWLWISLPVWKINFEIWP